MNQVLTVVAKKLILSQLFLSNGEISLKSIVRELMIPLFKVII